MLVETFASLPLSLSMRPLVFDPLDLVTHNEGPKMMDDVVVVLADHIDKILVAVGEVGACIHWTFVRALAGPARILWVHKGDYRKD